MPTEAPSYQSGGKEARCLAQFLITLDHSYFPAPSSGDGMVDSHVFTGLRCLVQYSGPLPFAELTKALPVRIQAARHGAYTSIRPKRHPSD